MSEENRLGSRDSAITLREITADTLWPVLELSKTLSEIQRTHVADNAVSIAQAHFSQHAWFRAIYANETPVGFIMIYIGPDEDQADEATSNPTAWFLWRFMIGGAYQKMGFGRGALEIVFNMVREQGGKELLVSCHPGPEGPEGFYRQLGFVPNGKYYDGELGMVLQLVGTPSHSPQ